MSSSDRIDGWKAIGAHFNRDRTTAMRWAQTRALPVRRIPGGKRATVYALKSDLDRWALSHADALSDPAPITPEPAVTRKPRFALWFTAALAAALVAGISGWLIVGRGTEPNPATRSAAIALPTDAALARLYLQARDDWAERTPESLTRAVGALETVTRREPDFAPAFAALADAYLLQREFGAAPDSAAFDAARAAARSALAIDADLAGAHRAMGFVQYWGDNRPVEAGRSFRRAIALTPDSAQTHFWYGNVLADNGQPEAAMRELSRARLLEPGSIAIQTDIAWADWSAGRVQEATEALERIIRMAPNFPVAHDCLAIFRLSQGDYAGYVEAYGRYARLRNDPTLLAQARSLEEGQALGLPVLRARLMAHAVSDAQTQGGRNPAWPAFVASVAEDRPAVRAILTAAVDRKARWGSAGLRAALARRWATDAEIIRLLDQLDPPPVE